eukprot:TRINITY_DN64_c4_g1_i2.p1 TRINITY_DN64_c4_g1~~TRINITY_DN64_c4_g1_i2.p1  ORF type:complete len:100 (+),score=10.38 TRINITY_DN64_c4_g1_i2:166-465(+)
MVLRRAKPEGPDIKVRGTRVLAIDSARAMPVRVKGADDWTLVRCDTFHHSRQYDIITTPVSQPTLNKLNVTCKLETEEWGDVIGITIGLLPGIVFCLLD